MILHEFAVEPACVAESLERFRYVTEKFGFHCGRLISRLPSGWEREVLNHAPVDLPQVARKSLVEKLKKMKQGALVSRGRAYDRSVDWLRNAEKSHETTPFHAVIAESNPRARSFVFPACELDGNEPPFANTRREARVPRTANEMADAVALLLQASRELVFVDRHFDPSKPRWRRPLRAFLKVANSCERQLACCEYHLGDKLGLSFFRESLAKLVEPVIPVGLAVRFFRWNIDRLHPRYILTEIGGVRIENGLDERRGGANTDVSLLDEGLWRERRAEYQRGTSPFQFVDETVVVGCG